MQLSSSCLLQITASRSQKCLNLLCSSAPRRRPVLPRHFLSRSPGASSSMKSLRLSLPLSPSASLLRLPPERSHSAVIECLFILGVCSLSAVWKQKTHPCNGLFGVTQPGGDTGEGLRVSPSGLTSSSRLLVSCRIFVAGIGFFSLCFLMTSLGGQFSAKRPGDPPFTVRAEGKACSRPRPALVMTRLRPC